ncbi:hypothetical protein HDV57DRAFT_188790 [Trichoderma longibrachiatum]
MDSRRRLRNHAEKLLVARCSLLPSTRTCVFLHPRTCTSTTPGMPHKSRAATRYGQTRITREGDRWSCTYMYKQHRASSLVAPSAPASLTSHDTQYSYDYLVPVPVPNSRGDYRATGLHGFLDSCSTTMSLGQTAPSAAMSDPCPARAQNASKELATEWGWSGECNFHHQEKKPSTVGQLSRRKLDWLDAEKLYIGCQLAASRWPEWLPPSSLFPLLALPSL